MANSKSEQQPSDGSPGRVTFMDGRGELPMLEVNTAWSTAGIYLQGAHVTHFKKKNEPPLLFLSQCSRFAENEPIRGGVPVIFPWFGPREGLPQHGFARLKLWELKEFAPAPDGSVSVRFRLPIARRPPPSRRSRPITLSPSMKRSLCSSSSPTNRRTKSSLLKTVSTPILRSATSTPSRSPV